MTWWAKMGDVTESPGTEITNLDLALNEVCVCTITGAFQRTNIRE